MLQMLRHFLAILTEVTINPKAVEGVSHQRGMTGSSILKTVAQAVIMIKTRRLRMPIAGILHFVRAGVTPFGIEGVEDSNT